MGQKRSPSFSLINPTAKLENGSICTTWTFWPGARNCTTATSTCEALILPKLQAECHPRDPKTSLNPEILRCSFAFTGCSARRALPAAPPDAQSCRTGPSKCFGFQGKREMHFHTHLTLLKSRAALLGNHRNCATSGNAARCSKS
jgi:hypothetical protein